MSKRFFLCALAVVFLIALYIGCDNDDNDYSSSGTQTLGNTTTLEAEDGSGDGHTATRSAASGGQSVRIRSGQTRNFATSVNGKFWLRVWYSNAEVQNNGKLERMDVSLNHKPVGYFTASHTSSGEKGWNVFLASPEVGPGPFNHSGYLLISVSANDGDSAGVEIDRVEITQ